MQYDPQQLNNLGVPKYLKKLINKCKTFNIDFQDLHNPLNTLHIRLSSYWNQGKANATINKKGNLIFDSKEVAEHVSSIQAFKKAISSYNEANRKGYGNGKRAIIKRCINSNSGATAKDVEKDASRWEIEPIPTKVQNIFSEKTTNIYESDVEMEFTKKNSKKTNRNKISKKDRRYEISLKPQTPKQIHRANLVQDGVIELCMQDAPLQKLYYKYRFAGLFFACPNKKPIKEVSKITMEPKKISILSSTFWANTQFSSIYKNTKTSSGVDTTQRNLIIYGTPWDKNKFLRDDISNPKTKDKGIKEGSSKTHKKWQTKPRNLASFIGKAQFLILALLPVELEKVMEFSEIYNKPSFRKPSMVAQPPEELKWPAVSSGNNYNRNIYRC
ncbi:hypothetical protein BB559_005587 [Furculomyces boomerangus]|uniref:Uncharacterized protein n=1 Tax=Furculomyces boomerangus TaxID=61424 RepID=A0A2T9Y7S8_9FUNG|nr:hypothetical protein BB559_005587 [Furculomyces boomerangus]